MPLYVNEMGHSFRENRSKILWFFNVTTMGQWWLGVCGAPSGQMLLMVASNKLLRSFSDQQASQILAV